MLWPENNIPLLYQTRLNGSRLLRWGLLYAGLLPIMFLLFSALATLGGRLEFVRYDLLVRFPWMPFLVASLVLGLVLTALAAWETLRNNRMWNEFFKPESFGPLLDRGFFLDRYGLHGFWKGLPLSIYYEKETLGDYAKITAYAAVSDDVEILRKLGLQHGKGWFFLPDEIERFVEPPFDNTDWPAILDEVETLITLENFYPAREHPWIMGAQIADQKNNKS